MEDLARQRHGSIHSAARSLRDGEARPATGANHCPPNNEPWSLAASDRRFPALHVLFVWIVRGTAVRRMWWRLRGWQPRNTCDQLVPPLHEFGVEFHMRSSIQIRTAYHKRSLHAGDSIGELFRHVPSAAADDVPFWCFHGELAANHSSTNSFVEESPAIW